MRYAAAAPTSPTSPSPAKTVVGEPDSGALPARTVSEACASGADGLAGSEPVVVGAVLEGDGVAAIEPEAVAAFFEGDAVPVDVVPCGVPDEVALGFVDEEAFGVGVVVARGVPAGLEALGVGPGVELGVELGLGLGFGVDDGLGLGALAAAGGAVSGALPEPKANPTTVPGAGL